MKTTVKRKIEITKLKQIFKKTIKNLVLYANVDWERKNWSLSRGKIEYKNKNGSFIATINKKEFNIISKEKYNTTFEIKINLEKETIILIHDGYRESIGPWWQRFLPKQFWEINSNWEIINYITSNPSRSPKCLICPQTFAIDPLEKVTDQYIKYIDKSDMYKTKSQIFKDFLKWSNSKNI